VAQLGHDLGLDLPDPLPGDPVDLADLIQGLGLAAGQPEPAPASVSAPAGRDALAAIIPGAGRPAHAYLKALPGLAAGGRAAPIPAAAAASALPGVVS
jgi:hypothetical protein